MLKYLNNKKIFITGHKGMVGSAFVRNLKKKNCHIITVDKKKINLLDQNKVFSFLKKKKPDIIIHPAAVVGGIMANDKNKVKFLYENTMINFNIIYGAHLSNINNLFFLGSSCIYPSNLRRSIKEEDLLTGKLEKTNEAYAIAKISSLKLCEYLNQAHKRNYITIMPCNLYGYNDKYDLNNSHVLPALIRKVHEAKKNKLEEIILWGSGKPLREFLFVDDLINACIKIMIKDKNPTLINVGSGKDISILNLLKLIMKTLKYECKIKRDRSKPDGTLKKLMDISYVKKIGWKSKISLKKGINLAYRDYIKRYDK